MKTPTSPVKKYESDGKSVLSLRIKDTWLKKIVSGEKVEEYRTPNDYYAVRFWDFGKKEFKKFDVVHLYCGNDTNGKYAVLECKMIRLDHFTIDRPDLGFKKDDETFTIYLGKLLETNYELKPG